MTGKRRDNVVPFRRRARRAVAPVRDPSLPCAPAVILAMHGLMVGALLGFMMGRR